MALALADSIATAGWDLNDQSRRFEGPAAMARSCDWLPFQSDMLICTRANWMSFPAWPGNRVYRAHASEQCVSACRYLATVLAALIHGEDRGEVLSPTWQPLKRLNDIQPLHPLIQEIAEGSFRKKQPPAIQGSGWVVKSLEASLWAFHNADSFEEAVLRAVNLGDDTDTTGATCGQLAGAFWGESNIPKSLRSCLARMDMLENALAGIL